MERFACFVVRRRLVLLIGVGLLTVWFGVHAARIRMDTDVLNFLPAGDEDVRFFKETGQRFGTNHINMVALEVEDVFSLEGLSALRALTDAVGRVRGVNQVLSLSNLPDMRQDGEGGISVAYLVDPAGVPRDPEVLADLRRRVLADSMLVGNLVSADGRAALISVMVDEQADKEKVAREVKRVARESAPGRKIYFGGFAMIMEYMSGLIARDMGRLVPITVAVVLLMLYAGLGSLRGVVLPMATVLLATVWTLGTMRLLGMALNMLTSIIPVVIIAIGTASGIYLLSRHSELADSGSGAEVCRRALTGEAGAVAFSGVTLVVGFLCLLSAPLSIFKEFGIAAAIGSFWAMALSLTLLPAWLSGLACARPRGFAIASSENRRATRVLGGIGRLVARRRAAVVLVMVLLAVGAVALIPGIPRNVNLMAYFPPGSEPRTSELLLQRHFGGSQLFMVNFRAGDVRAPAILEEMDLLGKRLRLIPDVNLPQSVADILKMLNRKLNNQPGLPDSMQKVNNLWFLLEGQPSVALLLEKTFANGVVQARIGDIDSAVVSRAIGLVREVLGETENASRVTIELNGQPEALRRVFAGEIAARIARKVGLDVKFHTGRDISAAELVPLLSSLLGEAPDLGAAQREELRSQVVAYFEGDVSSLRLAAVADRQAAGAAVAALKEFTRPAVANALQQALPGPAWQADPEGLDLDVDALRSFAGTQISKVRHEMALARLASLLGIDRGEPGNARLVEDLEANLWAVNNSLFAVAPEVYRRVTGKEPAEEEIVRFTTRLTGWPAVSSRFDAQLAGTLVRAISMAFLVILVLLVFRLRSLRIGLAAATPMLFTLLLNLAAMSLLRVPLDNTTLMISSIALGVGVMYAIHFTTRFQAELAAGVTAAGAIEAAAVSKGRAIAINTLTVALGFGVLVFSVMAPQRQFGLFIALTMVLANVGTFTLLPALLLPWGSGQGKATATLRKGGKTP